MITGIVETLKKERAEFAREVEYLKEDVYEDELDELMEKAEALYVKPNPNEELEEYKEAMEVLKEMDTDDTLTESEEVDRILQADHNLTFEEMIGIE